MSDPDGQDPDGLPLPVAEELTLKVDTAALAHRDDDARRDHLLFNLRRELELQSERIGHVEYLVLEALRRSGSGSRGGPKDGEKH